MLLDELDGDARLQVERTAPSYASGWLDDLVVPPDTDDVLGLVRSEYGGGSFRLRVKKRHADGRLRYTRGSANVQIAGESLFHGRRYNRDGTFVDERPPAPVAAPVVYPAQPQSQAELLQALASILQRQPQTPGAPPLQGIPELIGALNTAAHPPAADPYAHLERAVSLLGKLRRLEEGGGSGGGGENFDGAFGGSDEKMLMMLMGMQNQQQQQPPPGYPPYGYPPPGYPPPVYPQPQAQPPAPPPAQPQAQPQAPPATAPAAAQPFEAAVEPDDAESYTVDDVLDGIAGLSDTDKMELLSRVGDVLPDAVAAQMAQHVERGESGQS